MIETGEKKNQVTEIKSMGNHTPSSCSSRMEKPSPIRSQNQLKRPSATARRARAGSACAADPSEQPPRTRRRGPTVPTRSRSVSAQLPWERPVRPRCRWRGHPDARERGARRSPGASEGARRWRSVWWVAIRMRREWQGWSRTSASGGCRHYPPPSPTLPLPTHLPPLGTTLSLERRYMWEWRMKAR